LLDNPLAAITSRLEEVFSAEGIGDLLQGMAGFGGSLFLERLLTTKVITAIASPVGRIAATFVSGIALSTVSEYLIPHSAKKVFAGSLLATGWRALSEIVPAADKATFPVPLLAGMGAGEEAFKKAIEHEILKQMRGGVSDYIEPAGINEYFPPAGMDAYLTTAEAERAALPSPGVGAYLTASEALKAGMGAYDEFAGAGSPEKF
jgi:hypothetical protein